MHWSITKAVFEAESQSSQRSVTPVVGCWLVVGETPLDCSPVRNRERSAAETFPATSLQKVSGSSPPLRKMLVARTTPYCAYGPVSPSKLRASLKSNAITDGLVYFSMK